MGFKARSSNLKEAVGPLSVKCSKEFFFENLFAFPDRVHDITARLSQSYLAEDLVVSTDSCKLEPLCHWTELPRDNISSQDIHIRCHLTANLTTV